MDGELRPVVVEAQQSLLACEACPHWAANDLGHVLLVGTAVGLHRFDGCGQ